LWTTINPDSLNLFLEAFDLQAHIAKEEVQKELQRIIKKREFESAAKIIKAFGNAKEM